MNKSPGFMGVLVILLFFAAMAFAQEDVIVTESGLEYVDLKVGRGAAAEVGRIAVIHFIGWLDEHGDKGKQIFNSHDSGGPVAFKLGTDRVMQGWNIGIAGMKVGGKRRLMIPSELGYGTQGVEDLVPPNRDLIFEIELIEVK
jgi:FKBP-type peptidyl-prolyl cis-trans isomerase